MRINWILPEATSCGGTRVAFEYANNLKLLGHDVVCYSPKTGQHWGWKKIFFVKDVIRWIISPDLQGKWFNNCFDFMFPMWINDNGIRDADVTIATSWITAYWVNKLNDSKGKKVYFIQDIETWGTDRINKIVLGSYKLPFDRFITVSTDLHDRIMKETGTQSDVLCNSVESCFISKKNRRMNAHDKIVIGMPYRDTRGADIKNCSLGLRVLERLYKEYKVEISCFGFRKPEGWNDKFLFLENPSRDALADYYKSVDILYVPSVYEGWGLPAMEAMAGGKCVVAANTGIIKEIGVDGVNCVIIDNPKDEIESFEKIKMLIGHIGKIEDIGLNAQKIVSKMTYEENSLKFIDLIK